jgi:hypothetical protein
VQSTTATTGPSRSTTGVVHATSTGQSTLQAAGIVSSCSSISIAWVIVIAAFVFAV